MLTCQLLMAAMTAVKRFDTMVLHLWSSAREVLAGLRFWKTNGEVEY